MKAPSNLFFLPDGLDLLLCCCWCSLMISSFDGCSSPSSKVEAMPLLTLGLGGGDEDFSEEVSEQVDSEEEKEIVLAPPGGRRILEQGTKNVARVVARPGSVSRVFKGIKKKEWAKS